ncbi:class II aldolase/adducin family protein [Caulobacter sp. BK020]|uniref:class II aldolase/adducin family protein n=1 Tax=Caulobacter sp. BK020 TaxID=2512117 RepID=UPI00104F75E9|nr:class II aldolase/adducin family protein [Caulobacter sp. BK020]TCS11899.1 L-fuculose 1-phosphate aldolase [Caulobacter sp. BK020]
MAKASEADLREGLVDVMQAMDARGLNRGTSGNVSARLEGGAMLVSPSGVPAARLEPQHMVLVRADGSTPAGALKPSSEWRMHRQLLAARPDVNAVVHCHSRYATTLACAGRPIPPLHYMVAVAGGADIPIAPYSTFGSAELGAGVVETLAGRYGALMANHGQIALAPRLDLALAIAEEIEEQAAIYWGTLMIGGPTLLSAAEIDVVLQRFAVYGQGSRSAEDR